MSLYKYTDNNNVFNLSNITGDKGKTGFTGILGPKGTQGDKGLTGDKGDDFDKKTDICFSGTVTPYISILPQQLTKIGHFISKNPNEITSIKVLVRPVTNTISTKIVVSVLNLTATDSFGSNVLAYKSLYMNGVGGLENLIILNIDLLGSTFPSIESILGVYAQIKQGEDTQFKYLDVFYLSAE